MHLPTASSFTHLGRRQFLRTTGVALGLPWFQSIARGVESAGKDASSPGYTPDGQPRRMLCICNHLGLHGPFFKPTGQGMNWQPSRYLKEVAAFREQMTIFSGVHHPDVDGGHSARKSFLTTAPHPGGASFRNSISLDQYAADFIGRQTRFPSLTLSTDRVESLSWTRAGVPIPPLTRASQVFKKLFLNGSKDEVERQLVKLRQGQSIMDHLLAESKSVQRQLSGEDKSKFDEYLTSVREVEQQMLHLQEWEKRPKPKVAAKMPKDVEGQADVIGSLKLMFDLSHLAFQSDSTRLITIETHGEFVVPPVNGVTQGYHTLSHHGQNPEKIEQLALIETEHMRIFNDLLGRLHRTQENGATLLDRTMVLYGSEMGNASSHDNRNLPFILAGGGFKHGQHLEFDAKNNEPIAPLFVSMLNRLGIEADRFGSATRTMRGLELM
jgi:hypothetical protein